MAKRNMIWGIDPATGAETAVVAIRDANSEPTAGERFEDMSPEERAEEIAAWTQRQDTGWAAMAALANKRK